MAKTPSSVGDSRIFVLRIDPARWQMQLVGVSRTGHAARTAREWSQESGFPIVTNAGMFGADYKTHVGYMETGGHVNSSRINKYQSVAAFDPRGPAHAPFRIFDLDAPGVSMESIREYASMVQNLRLIKRPGKNRWSKQDKKWSEAALGEDEDGNVLLVFSRSPFSMHRLNRELLDAAIGLAALQHLEGGPEAQLYMNVGNVELELVGSYETSFYEHDGNATAWPIPNVLGIKRRAGTARTGMP